MAAGEVVVASRAFADRVANRKLLALEMEAGRAALACHHNNSVDLLVIRRSAGFGSKLRDALRADSQQGCDIAD